MPRRCQRPERRRSHAAFAARKPLPALRIAELAKESREAAARTSRRSSSIRRRSSWWRKFTGLSLDDAYWLCVVLNFAVVAGAIVYFSKKNLPGMFRNRTASIQKAMQEARQASEDANRRLAEIETRLSRLDSEIAGMRAAAEKEAVAEEARIKAAAEEDARKIVESAEQEIAAAAKLARRESDRLCGEFGGVAGGQADQGGYADGPGAGARFCPAELSPEERQRTGTRRMASVTSTYARAFADVVFDQHLDPAKTLQEAQSLCAVGGGQPGTAGSMGSAFDSGGTEAALCWTPSSRARVSPGRCEILSRSLMDHRRIKFLDPIVKEFEQELNRRMGFVEAQITSARELGEPERSALEAQVAKVDRPQSARALRRGSVQFWAAPSSGLAAPFTTAR